MLRATYSVIACLYRYALDTPKRAEIVSTAAATLDSARTLIMRSFVAPAAFGLPDLPIKHLVGDNTTFAGEMSTSSRFRLHPEASFIWLNIHDLTCLTSPFSDIRILLLTFTYAFCTLVSESE